MATDDLSECALYVSRSEAVYAPRGYTTGAWNWIGQLIVDLESHGHKDELRKGFERYGPHYFEEIREDSFVHEDVAAIIGPVDPLVLTELTAVLNRWANTFIQSEDEFEAWIDSTKCELLRRATCTVVLRLLKFAPLTTDGRLLFMSWDETKAIKSAQQIVAGASEWGEPLLDDI